MAKRQQNTTKNQSLQAKEGPNTIGSIRIEKWADEDKPREKLLMQGKKSLTNAELLAIVLGSGVPGLNVVDLSKQILDHAENNLLKLSKYEIGDLTEFHGIGTAKAVSIAAAMELGYRMLSQSHDSEETTIKSSEDLYRYIAHHIINLPQEEFWAIFINARGKVLAHRKISAGGMTNTPVDLKILFGHALESKCTSFAIAHNHPSGNLTPSPQDQQLTEKIKKAADILGLKLIDHIIIGMVHNEPLSSIRNYWSFCDHGEL